MVHAACDGSRTALGLAAGALRLRGPGRDAAVDPRRRRHRAGGPDGRTPPAAAAPACTTAPTTTRASCGIAAAHQSARAPGRRPRQGGHAGRRGRHRRAALRRLDQRAAGRRRRRGARRPGRCTTGWSAARWSAATTRAGTCTRPSCRPGTPRRSPSTATGSAGRGDRLRAYVERSRTPASLDEPATARALADFLLRGLDCGAADATEVRDGQPGWTRSPTLRTAATTTRRRLGSSGMGIVLGANQYGKAENRVVRIVRDTARHEIRDLNVSTSLRGDFAAAHVDGDQSHVLPTDTQKNTAFAYAKQHGVTSPEDYALALGTPAPRGHARPRPARRCASRSTPGTASRSTARPRPRVRAPRRRDPHRASSTSAADERPRVVRAAGPGGAEVHRLGVQGLPDRRVHHPARGRRPHPGHLADRRAGGTTTTSRRRLERVVRRRCAALLLATFATTYCRALQETLYAMGTAVLDAHAGDRGDPVLGAQQAPLPGRPRRRSGWRTTARSSSPPTGPTA